MSIRKSLAWSFSQEGTQKFVQFAGSIVIARLLTPDEVGIFSIAMAANFLLGSLREFGVNTYLIREPELTSEKVRTVFGISLAVQWSLALIILFIRHPFAELYGEPGIAHVLSVVILLFLIGPFGGPAQALLRRDMRFDLLHHISAASVITATAATITLAALGFSYMSMAWGMLCGSVVRTGLTLLARRDHLRLRPGLRHWREVMHFGSWLTGKGLVGTFASEGNKLIVGGLLTPGALALFERGQQVPNMSREILFKPVGRVLFPQFSKDIRNNISIGPKIETYVASTTLILWPAYTTTAFLSIPIITMLFGQDWRVAGEILPFLLVGAMIRATIPLPEEILTAYGYVRRLFFSRLCLLFNTLAFGILGALHSLEMFAMLRIPASVVFLGINYLFAFPFAQTSIRRLLPFYGKAVGLAASCATPALVAYLAYGTEMPIYVLLVVAGTAGVIWLVGLFSMGHPLEREVRSLLRTARARVPLPERKRRA